MAYRDTQLLIDGRWQAAGDGRRIEVIDPATGQVIGHVAHAGRSDMDAALMAADRAFAAWRHTSPLHRSDLLRKAAALLRERAETIAALMVAEQGKPLAQARLETLAGAEILEWFAEEARRTYGQVIPPRQPGVTQLTLREPLGPVAAFTPWNFPINQAVRKLSAALAAGCTIIVKAPEETPASPAELIRCLVDAGIPAGVVNLLYGDPAEISSYLIPHPVIRKVSFTGSTAVGKELAALAGRHMKPATMELGGHAPVLIFDDADVDAAVAAMVPAKLRNAGQVCISPTRFLVQDGVADRFTMKFTQAMAAARVGPGMSPDSDMGPLANVRRIPAIERLIRDALDRGARLATGGARIGNEGWFFAPTVLTDVPGDAAVMNEEPFGPIAVVNRFGHDDEAFAEANRLPYGLAAYAWTRSSARVQRLQDEIQAGMLTINHIGLSLPELPFGGLRDSGMGTEGGSEAIGAYLQTRFVTRKG
ncbi:MULTISPECIES: NAD-dependent succinate-semialdehyde dehydrogenase [unclassified Paracoccus (in: a-proteobacteria)]|uniref:NAD-dependent succinate-semialdehyde dehydrogenase n=1 Tax=unclassified Paracoccus (in: a-proteobacteria) TaxID=2688777 RepID=UPI0012B3FD1D|nr:MULTISPECIES: NAD-dependent succinate-semialdehyde dehydrogenase [unclassified Paracoccus (in: a-proteobacteria)]UXU74107.1 NAD-dependent succinate-semialdehyde dehydrogenase [Paracoccus sp. SMMA_5]UXU79996.1 NAD-dependent succinate-semialdehyde dehydrogenase [Paracoccus sp. SMMA_5_TC]